MNIYILGGNLELKNALEKHTDLISFFDSVISVDIVQNLYPTLVKKSGCDPFLVVLPESFYATNLIPKVLDFLPYGLFLILCDNAKSYLSYRKAISLSNCFVCHKDLTNLPSELLIKLKKLHNKEIIIPNTRYTLHYSENEIVYLESQKHRIRIHTQYHEDVIYSKLSDITVHLTNQFLRVHQSYIINRHYITDLYDEYVILNHTIVIPISRTYSGLLRSIYKEDEIKSSKGRGRRKKTDAP